MKKLFLYATVSGFLFTACQKEENQSPELPNGSKSPTTANISPVPATFIKKVMVEEFTSSQNGDAPQSSREIALLLKSNQDRIIPVSIHTNDIMAHIQSNRLMTAFTPGNASVPSATIDRIAINNNTYQPSSMYWSIANASLNKPVECGIAINSSIIGRTAQVDVHTGFANTYSGNYKVTVYLVEDKALSANPAFYQANAYNATFGSPFYNLGNPITNFTHNNVVRRVLSDSMGDAINPAAQIPGGSDVKTFKIDLPEKYNSNSNWKIAAFITDNTTNEVLNAQSATLGILKDWN